MNSTVERFPWVWPVRSNATVLPAISLLACCLALSWLTGCQPSQKERRQIGGKGKEIQLTWEEEQSRSSEYGIDRDGNPPPLLDCEERAWKNMRALGISTPDRFRIDAEGDSFVQVGQYAFRKPKGYGGSGNNPVGGDARYFATLPDFSPMYQVNHALCDDAKALRDSSGNVIDGSTCRRYDVVDGIASLASIWMQCIDRDAVSDIPGFYWPTSLPKDKTAGYIAHTEKRITGKLRSLVDWSSLTRVARPELGLYEYTGQVWKDFQGKPEEDRSTVFYEPMDEPKTWHLGQPIIFVCSAAYDAATAAHTKLACGGPSMFSSRVAPGLSAGMSFPIKFLPQWRELTARFTNFVTTYQTSDPTAPRPALAVSHPGAARP